MREKKHHRELSHLPTLPSLRVLFLVEVPLGNRSHFQLPTLSYFKGSPDEELA